MMRRQSSAEFPGRSKVSHKIWGLWAFWTMSLLYSVFQGGKMAYMVLMIMTILCIYLMLGRWSGIKKTKGTRTLLNVPPSGEIAAGTSLEVEVSIQIPGIWPVPYVLMKDALSRKNQTPYFHEFSIIPDWKRRGRIVYRTQPLRRGRYAFHEMICSTEDIFGFFHHEGLIPLKQSFVVLPKTVQINQWHHFEQMQRGFHYQSPSTRMLRETTQINGVRDYVYGDKMTRIHWNATARTGEWKSKEFEREALPKTIFVLDRNMASYANEDAFELAVSTAASLIKFGRDKAVPQGLLSHGSELTYFETGLGNSHMTRMLRHLTEVEADGNASIDRLMKEFCSRTDKGSFFVVITGESGDRMENLRLWLQNTGHHMCHMWIAPNASYEEHANYVNAVMSQGHGYLIPSLTELPSILEGRYQ